MYLTQLKIVAFLNLFDSLPFPEKSITIFGEIYSDNIYKYQDFDSMMMVTGVEGDGISPIIFNIITKSLVICMNKRGVITFSSPRLLYIYIYRLLHNPLT